MALIFKLMFQKNVKNKMRSVETQIEKSQSKLAEKTSERKQVESDLIKYKMQVKNLHQVKIFMSIFLTIVRICKPT